MQSLEKRIAALEAPFSGSCLECEMGRLNGTPPSKCTHNRALTLADHLRGIPATVQRTEGTGNAKS